MTRRADDHFDLAALLHACSVGNDSSAAIASKSAGNVLPSKASYANVKRL